MADIKKFIEEVKSMTVVELNELVKALESEFGVSAAAPAAVAVAAGPAAAAAPVEEEKTEFDVVLKAAGGQKLQVIKVAKEVTGLPLTEAKALVDNAPSTIKSALPKDEANALKKKFEDVGAEIELK